MGIIFRSSHSHFGVISELFYGAAEENGAAEDNCENRMPIPAESHFFNGKAAKTKTFLKMKVYRILKSEGKVQESVAHWSK